MKKSKKPIIGGILLGLGVVSFGGIANADNKVTLVMGALVLIVVGGLLLYFGIKKNKEIAAMPASAAPPVAPTSSGTVLRDMHSKIAGVTFGNDDGTSRQAYIQKLKPGEELIVRHMPTSDHPEAIGVFTRKNKQIGYLNADLAAEINSRYANNRVKVTVSNITGGGDKNYGCNIHIIIYG